MQTKKLFRKETDLIHPINWGEVSGNKIRLLWGENPIKANQEIKRAIIKEISNINKYPDPEKSILTKKLASYNKVNPKNILITNGSDEAIDLIAKTFIDKGDEVIFPVPTFPTYGNAALLMGGIVRKVLLDKELNLNVKDIFSRISKKTKLIFIANPNNPSGNILISNAQISKLAAYFKGVIIIDECYYEFSKKTAVPLIKKFKNIIVLRSMSKTFALAGLRVGYMVAHEDIASKLSAISNTLQPFNVNRIAQVAAVSALNHKKQIIKQFEGVKESLLIELKKIKEIKVFDTLTSFVILDLSKTDITAKELKEKMEKRGVLIKDCGIFENFGPQYAYLGIPPKDKIKKVINSIKGVLK